ncbi:uncharacterized protein EV422DRAFT_544407 [Fimicolochytrium jonesii]|uniref:uncharacterized protein n=1 Tax=Fimicolochytrium jonesii TaxID=1396493 RepID=UPI0022FEF7E9|nr:uncharacterized protein EV422DRAFT_544407 [Fimicolochytrium jonesii]KAI8816889.1 hypothetical protein EV422DRAFT_544407 [Fimicolochytrium jonesii]
MESSRSPLQGTYKPTTLQQLSYGPNSVKDNLLAALPKEDSRAFIVTGNSLATKTPLVKEVEELLGKERHAVTFSKIKQHAPVKELDEAVEVVLKAQGDHPIDTIISIGGGSPIDSAKAISFRVYEKTGHYLRHIAIPTTLSAAECTFGAGFTQPDGTKQAISQPGTLPTHVFYDPRFGAHTPPDLFISTGIRALDHAIELQYHPTATWMPCQLLALSAIKELFTFLPKYKQDPQNPDTITRLFLAAYASLGFLGSNIKGGLGLSHTLGYALGSPYGIPHGITSCLTLGHVVKLKARSSPATAAKIAEILPFIGTNTRSDDDVKDAEKVGDKILELVRQLGFKTTLTKKNVGRDQLDVIVERATGGLSKKEGISGEEREMVEGVRKLVEGLY